VIDGTNNSYALAVRPQVALAGNPLHFWGALLVLLVLGGLAIGGPLGFLSWYEHEGRLKDREQRIAVLQEEIAALENRVDLLDPDRVDSDLAGELARRNLGVLHPDEVVITLPDR